MPAPQMMNTNYFVLLYLILIIIYRFPNPFDRWDSNSPTYAFGAHSKQVIAGILLTTKCAFESCFASYGLSFFLVTTNVPIMSLAHLTPPVVSWLFAIVYATRLTPKPCIHTFEEDCIQSLHLQRSAATVSYS